MTTRYLEDLTLGVPHTVGDHVLTEQEIVEFARMWDPRPWHVDPEAARGSMFGELVACAAHLFSVRSRLALEEPIAVLAGLRCDGFTLEAPGRVGDHVRLRRTFLSRRVSRSRPHAGVLHQRSELVTGDDRRITVQEDVLLVARRPDLVGGSRPT